MTGFIGAGNMASAMISGLVSSGTLKGKDLAVFDICNEKSKKFLKQEKYIELTKNNVKLIDIVTMYIIFDTFSLVDVIIPIKRNIQQIVNKLGGIQYIL